MSNFFNRLLGKEAKSAGKAKERLQLVLIHDRTDLAPGLLESLRDEIVAVISKHVDIDPNAVRLEMSHEGRAQRLIADIPLKPATRRSR